MSEPVSPEEFDSLRQRLDGLQAAFCAEFPEAALCQPDEPEPEPEPEPPVTEPSERVVLEGDVDGLTVNVEAVTDQPYRNYRFHFGDGARRPWDSSPTASHTYSEPGEYTIVLDAAEGGVQSLQVAATTVAVGGAVQPEPEPEPPVDPEPPVEEPTEPEPVDSTGLPYTADSFFKSRVDGAGVPVNASRTAQFHQFMANGDPDQQGITWPKFNTNANWAMSYHVHRKGDSAPVWKLVGGNTNHEKLRVLTTQGFHMADSVADTFPAGDQDRPGVIIDEEFGYTVQFADAVPNKANRTITVSNAGVFWHSSNGLDYRNPKSNDSRNFSSRGRILDAMIVRRDELDKAVQADTGLGHVLHLYFVQTKTSDGHVHPMVGDESGKEGFGAEGERIRIKPSVDLEARGLTGAALAVARTLQQHGGYLGDNSGSGTQVKFSQAQFYQGTNITTDALKDKVFWTDFEVVEQGWQ